MNSVNRIRRGFFAVAGIGFVLILLSVLSVYMINITPVEPSVYGRALVGVVSLLSFATAIGGVMAVLMAWILYITVGSITRFYLYTKEEEETEGKEMDKEV